MPIKRVHAQRKGVEHIQNDIKIWPFYVHFFWFINCQNIMQKKTELAMQNKSLLRKLFLIHGDIKVGI